MSWAAARRALIIGIILVAVLAVVGIIAFLTLHKAPSCTDGLQNEDERGVDCGGSCAYLCSADVAAPVISFVRDLRLPNGRTDVIAYLENPNSTAAARAVPFTITLYGPDRVVIAEKQGVVDLPPRGAGATPVYVPNFFSGSQEVAQAFLDIDETGLLWSRYEDKRLLPVIDDPELEGADAPRVRVGVENPHATALRNVRLVVTVFDGEGNAIGASQTVIAELLPGARTEAVFTWNAPFVGTPSVVDVKSVIPLTVR